MAAAFASLAFVWVPAAPAYAAGDGPDATVAPPEQLQVLTGLSRQPAGGWAIHLGFPYEVSPTGMGQLVLAVRDSTDANCAAADATIGYSAKPRVVRDPSPANDNEGAVLEAALASSEACSSFGVADELLISIDTALLPMDVVITGVDYDVGISAFPGAVRVSVTGSCLTGCDPGFNELNATTAPGYFANAVVATRAVPGLPDLQITSHESTFDASQTRLDLTVGVTNQGDVTAPVSKLEFDAPGWHEFETVPELTVGETGYAYASFVLTDGVRGSSPTFRIILDPNGEIPQKPSAPRSLTFRVAMPLIPPERRGGTTETSAEKTTPTVSETTTTTTTTTATTASKREILPVSNQTGSGGRSRVGWLGGGVLVAALGAVAVVRYRARPSPTARTSSISPPPNPEPQWSVGPHPDVRVEWTGDIEHEVTHASAGPALGFAIRIDPPHPRIRWEAR